MKRRHSDRRVHQSVVVRFSARLLAFLLFVVLIVSPLAPALANEDSSETSTQSIQTSETATSESPPVAMETAHEPVSTDPPIGMEPGTEPAQLDETNVAEVIASDITALNEDTLVVGDLETVPTEVATSSEEIELVPPTDPQNESSILPLDQATDTPAEPVVDDASISDNQLGEPATEDLANVATTTDETPVPPVETTTDDTATQPEAQNQNPTTTPIEATSTEPVPNTVDLAAALTNDDNLFKFSKNECVAMGDGTFYCTNASSSPIAVGADRVFSASDSDGDKEIYIERGGVLTQITFNLYDDDGPYYDQLSNTISWHRLIDGRYQIITYDLGNDTERQVTDERYNNMQPARYGDVIVWQGWIGNDWEIMLEDAGELTMLTDNVTQDISPRINGDYIIWQAFEDNAWRVKVYDRVAKTTNTIAEADGASVENPRFVLVYDSKSGNGDVETKGYDLESKQSVPLSSTPRPTPQDLPSPDQTGENRALVQSTVQVKTKTEGDVPLDPETSGDPGPIPDVATSTGDIIITPYTEPIGTSTDALLDAPTVGTTTEQSSVPDLAIPSFDTSVSTATEPIVEDLIITPYVEPIVNPLVASSSQDN